MRSLWNFWENVTFDPATLTAVALGASALTGAGTLAATALNKPKAPSTPAPAPPSQNPTGTPTTNANQPAPSFLAAAAAPQGGQAASKTLLGT